MKRTYKTFVQTLFLSLLLVSCLVGSGCAGAPSSESTEPAVEATAVEIDAEIAMTTTPETAVAEPPPFRVIAYITGAIIPELIPYERLTHINYSFLIPNDDGTFAPFANGWKLKNIATEAHKQDVKVLVAVGGWGWDDEFETIAADPALRATFIENLSAFVAEYGLDGVDLDWEYPDPGQSAQNFLLLTQELHVALPDKLLTTAVVAYGATGEGILSETFDLFDFVNIMTYEGPDHGTVAQFNQGLAYWQGRGLPAAKTVMGVPFYADPNGVFYRKIVEADPQAAQVDSVEWKGTTIHYNGIPTIRQKTQLAMEQAGGIMFWTLDHDAHNELSLLQAIDAVVTQADPP